MRLQDTSQGLPGLTYTCRQYGHHELQRVGIWQPSGEEQQQQNTGGGHWIIFIHGGAWRDPRNTHQDFVPSIRHMCSSPEAKNSAIRGFISIDYRLSSYSDFPQDPADTPDASLRRAVHPDHIFDIHSALGFLVAEYQLSSDYVLVGHSAGATLSYQLLMGRVALNGQQSPPVPLPAAIVGISGIYDLVGLNARHDGQYAGFISDAFGPDEEVWIRASPACFGGNFKDEWTTGSTSILASSADDSLIDDPELDSMASKLTKDGLDVSIRKDLTGEHDFSWQDGRQVASLVAQALSQLRKGHVKKDKTNKNF